MAVPRKRKTNSQSGAAANSQDGAAVSPAWSSSPQIFFSLGALCHKRLQEEQARAVLSAVRLYGAGLMGRALWGAVVGQGPPRWFCGQGAGAIAAELASLTTS